MSVAAGNPSIRPSAGALAGTRRAGRGGPLAAAWRAGALLVLAIGAPVRVLGVLATHGYLADGPAHGSPSAPGAAPRRPDGG